MNAFEQIAKGMRLQAQERPINGTRSVAPIGHELHFDLFTLAGSMRPNLVLWNGERHELVIELKNDFLPIRIKREAGEALMPVAKIQLKAPCCGADVDVEIEVIGYRALFRGSLEVTCPHCGDTITVRLAAARVPLTSRN